MESLDDVKQMVAQSLEAAGVMASIKAQLRAAVFTAIDEEESKHGVEGGNPGFQRLVADPQGQKMVAVLKEFLEFYNLQYTASVLHSEASSDPAIGSVDRGELSKDLGLSHCPPNQPLLAALLQGASAGDMPKPSTVPASTPLSPVPELGGAGAIQSPSGYANESFESSGALDDSSHSAGGLGAGPGSFGGTLATNPSLPALPLAGGLPGGDAPPSPTEDVTDDDLLAALSGALGGEEEEEVKPAVPPPAPHTTVGPPTLAPLGGGVPSLGSPGALEALVASGEEESPPVAPRGPREEEGSAPGSGVGDISSSFEDTATSAELGGTGSPPKPAGAWGTASPASPHLADSPAGEDDDDEEDDYGDSDFEEEEVDEIEELEEDIEEEVVSGGEEEVLSSTAVPLSTLSPSAPAGSGGDDLALSLGDSRSMGDSAAALSPLAPAGDGLNDSVTEPLGEGEAGAYLEGFDLVESVEL